MLTLAAWQQLDEQPLRYPPLASGKLLFTHLLILIGYSRLLRVDSYYNKNKERIEEAQLFGTWVDGVFSVLD